jgi:RNA polymerase-binding transcription factor
MNTRDLTRLRAVLTARREQLQTTLCRIQQELRGTTSVHADSADQAVASYDKNTLHQQSEQASRQLLLLDEALRRINAGDYGECVMCGTDIAIARLEAIPWARYCVDCQQMQEQGLFGGN